MFQPCEKPPKLFGVVRNSVWLETAVSDQVRGVVDHPSPASRTKSTSAVGARFRKSTRTAPGYMGGKVGERNALWGFGPEVKAAATLAEQVEACG